MKSFVIALLLTLSIAEIFAAPRHRLFQTLYNKIMNKRHIANIGFGV
jgi:hypothetical protein